MKLLFCIYSLSIFCMAVPAVTLGQEYSHYNNHYDDEHYEPAENTKGHQTLESESAEETGEEEEIGFDEISKNSLSKIKQLSFQQKWMV